MSLYVFYKCMCVCVLLHLCVCLFVCVCVSDSDSKHVLYGRAMRSAVRLDPLELMGKRYKVHTHQASLT